MLGRCCLEISTKREGDQGGWQREHENGGRREERGEGGGREEDIEPAAQHRGNGATQWWLKGILILLGGLCYAVLCRRGRRLPSGPLMSSRAPSFRSTRPPGGRWTPTASFQANIMSEKPTCSRTRGSRQTSCCRSVMPNAPFCLLRQKKNVGVSSSLCAAWSRAARGSDFVATV